MKYPQGTFRRCLFKCIKPHKMRGKKAHKTIGVRGWIIPNGEHLASHCVCVVIEGESRDLAQSMGAQ